MKYVPQQWQSLVHEIVADMLCSLRITFYPWPATRRQSDCTPDHLVFGQPALPSDVFYNVAVSIAGGKIHLAVESSRIFAESLFDHARTFDELPPIGGP